MEVTAYHEAGHAVLAVWVGARVRQVTIEPDWDDGPRRTGDTQIDWDITTGTNRELHEKAVLVALAGPVAEMIYTDAPYHPGLVAEWGGDWEMALLAAASFQKAHHQCVAHLEEATRYLLRLLKDDVCWAAVAEVADLLLAHETLEEEQVLDAVSTWMS